MATSPNYSWPEPDNTDLVKNGALAMRTLGNAIDTTMATMTPKSTVTAKGSLIAATAASTPANLAVGNNGETLVADSSTSTGLRWQGSQAAGKNYLINGGFDIWQRGTSYALPATTINYGAADRWCYYSNAVTGRTASRQTASLAGFTYSQRIQRDSGNTNTQSTHLVQLIESSVATSLQGQYVTVSFWAKVGANYSVASSNITVVLYAGTGTDQNPYTTGYTGQTTPISTSQAITTSWAKYSFTTSAVLASTITELTLAIQSGAFVGTAGANDWFEVTGVQLEAGQTGTLFTRAGGTIQGELAACQRYYEKSYDLATAPATAVETGSFGFCVGTNSTAANYFTYAPVFKVAKRGTPTITLYDLSGNSGKVNKVSATDLSMTANQTATADRIGETEFRIYSALNTAGGFYGHYVASAEL